MLFSGIAGTSEIFRNSTFILIMCSLLLSKAHGGIEEKNEWQLKKQRHKF